MLGKYKRSIIKLIKHNNSYNNNKRNKINNNKNNNKFNLIRVLKITKNLIKPKIRNKPLIQRIVK